MGAGQPVYSTGQARRRYAYGRCACDHELDQTRPEHDGSPDALPQCSLLNSKKIVRKRRFI